MSQALLPAGRHAEGKGEPLMVPFGKPVLSKAEGLRINWLTTSGKGSKGKLLHYALERGLDFDGSMTLHQDSPCATHLL